MRVMLKAPRFIYLAAAKRERKKDKCWYLSYV